MCARSSVNARKHQYFLVRFETNAFSVQTYVANIGACLPAILNGCLQSADVN